jgi:hypothetical protein
MNQKPNNIYILETMWIIIGVLFILITINSLLDFLRSRPIFDGINGYFTATVNFSFIYYILLSIFLSIISFLIAYKFFIKKDLFWLIGLMFSSFLMYYAINGIHYIGLGIVSGKTAQIFSDLDIIVPMIFIFLIPCQIFLLFRSDVKVYFGKKVEDNKEKEIKTVNKMITKTIECPVCKENIEVQGISGERVEITCKKCKSKGFFNFR